jgi:hypothetical protein
MWKNICEAITLKGKRCKKKKNGECFCTIHKFYVKKVEKELDICSICLDKPFIKEKLDCNHHFCRECIYKWICTKKSNEINCPICRKYINYKYLKYNAYIYGLDNNLLYKAYITTFSLSLLSLEEYNSIKTLMELFKNMYLTEKKFLLIKDTISIDIYEKLQKHSFKTQRLFISSHNNLCPSKQYFIFQL